MQDAEQLKRIELIGMSAQHGLVELRRDGKIAEVWHNVKVPGHAEAVLKAAQTLG